MAEPASILAAAFLRACADRGLDPPDDLRLLRHRPAHTAPVVALGELGVLHEQLVGGEDRARRGAWYTPRAVADDLVGRAVAARTGVADPACGGGVFLLAAAERLLTLGADPATIVRELLWGADVDPLAVAVAEAELWAWSAMRGAPTVAGERLVVGESLDEITIPRAGAVVGNPPFLGQLKSATSIDRARRDALTERWGDAVRPYTDQAWLFLLASVRAVEPGGTVAMIQPQSLLAARDAAAVRAEIDVLADLVDCWVDDGTTFDAAVDVCAPVLRRQPTHPTTGSDNDWVAPLLTAHEIPAVGDFGAGTLDDRAEVFAGFRDEYYGLIPAMVEGGAGPRFVTSGAVDPLRVRDEPIRFAKQRWDRPTVDVERAEPRARRWVERQLRPKLVVASQTRVVEAAVDEDGTMVAGVPAVVVVPHDPSDLWHLAAVLHAPAVSAWLLRHTIGTGLAAASCRPTAELIARIPLPTVPDRWDDAARAAEAIATVGGDWTAFARLADAAYRVDHPETSEWWLTQLPRRCAPEVTPR